MRAIETRSAPAAIGPYSQAVIAGSFVFTSGQLPVDPATGNLIAGDIAVQTRRVIENLRAVLQAAGCDLTDVVQTTVYLADLAGFAEMNTVYGEYFGHRPARSTIQAARLPKDALVEIDCLAVTRR